MIIEFIEKKNNLNNKIFLLIYTLVYIHNTHTHTSNRKLKLTLSYEWKKNVKFYNKEELWKDLNKILESIFLIL